MRQVAVVVEGQTEAAFISQVLAPRLGPEILLHPMLVKTRVTARGADRGGGSWTPYRKQIATLVHQSHWDLVTTMIDFYGYPRDAPGRDCHPPGEHRDPTACAAGRVQAMSADIEGSWLPFLVLHEFESLVIAAGSRQDAVLGDPDAPARFDRLIREAGGVERINDGPDTAPSKRVAQILPRYRKAQDAVAILESAPLDDVLTVCPTLRQWIDHLGANA